MKKYFVCLLTVLILMFSFSTVVFASSSITYELGDFADYAEKQGYDLSEYPYYVVYGYHYVPSDTWIYRCFFSTKKLYYLEEMSNLAPLDATYVDGVYNNPQNTKVFYVGYTVENGCNDCTAVAEPSLFHMWHSEVDMGEVMYSNYNITCFDSSDVFFLSAPIPKGHVTIGRTLTPQIMANHLTKEVVLLVPLLIGLVVLLIGCRKGLTMLFRLLHHG